MHCPITHGSPAPAARARPARTCSCPPTTASRASKWCRARSRTRGRSPRPLRSSAPLITYRSSPAASPSHAAATPLFSNSPERISMTLPVPSHFDPKRAAAWDYRPDAAALATDAAAWRKQHAVKPSAADERRVHMLLIDVQKDFCFPEGTLYVAGRSGTGAIDDSRRIGEMIYRNHGAITDITTTLDTHLAYQI